MHKKYFFFDIDQTLGLGISHRYLRIPSIAWMPSRPPGTL